MSKTNRFLFLRVNFNNRNVRRKLLMKDLKTSNQKYVRVKHIANKIGIAESTVYAWVKSGKLPQSHAKLSPKCTVWLANEVDAAIDRMINNPDPKNDKNNFEGRIAS